MGNQFDWFFVSVLVILSWIPGVHGAGTEVGLIVAGVVVGVLILTLILAVSFIYFLRESKTSKKPKHKRRPEKIVNGKAKYIPNGNTPRGPQMGPYHVPRMMPGPMPIPGTYRGPPPVFAPTISSRHPRMMPRMPFYNPYFFQPYGPQIIYVDSSESDSDDVSVRSTVKEKKKRYRHSFLSKGLASSIVIKDKSEKSAGTPRSHASHRELDEAVDNERSRPSSSRVARENSQVSSSRARSRSRSKSQTRSSSRSCSPSPVLQREEDYRHSHNFNTNNSPVLTSGFFTRSQKDDTAFVPIPSSHQEFSKNRTPTPPPSPQHKPEEDPTPEPSSPVDHSPSPVPGPSYASEYQYTSAIRPPDNPLSVTAKSSWTDADDNLRQSRTAAANPLRMSMSDRMMGIVEDGYSHKPSEFDRMDSYEYPVKGADLSKTQKEEDVYAVSLRHSSKRPNTPPNDYTPRNSQNVPEADYNNDEGRPPTPPFDADGLTPKHSFKEPERNKPPVFGNHSTDILKNQVLMEMKSRLRSNGEEDNSHAPTRSGLGVNFNSDLEIIPNSNRASRRDGDEEISAPPPVPAGFIPPPPPPPPIPK